MLQGAYSNQYKIQQRTDIETLREIALSDKHDTIAKARRLSQETNKRRKTMAQKKKAMAQREEKRRQEILAQRREEQCKATEKYQRSNLGSARHGHRKRSPRQSFYLEDTLRLIRGSSAGSTRRVPSPKSPGKSSSAVETSGNSDPLNRPYFSQYHSRHLSPHSADKIKESNREHREMLDTSLRNFNNSRNLFQQQLEQHQQLLIADQEKSLRHFNDEIQHEMERDLDILGMKGLGDEIPRSPSLSSLDSLEQSQSYPVKSHTDPPTHLQQPATDLSSLPHYPPQSQPSLPSYSQPLSQPAQPTTQTISSYASGYNAQTSIPPTYQQQQQVYAASSQQQQQQQALSTASQQQHGYSGAPQQQQQQQQHVYSTANPPQYQGPTAATEQGHGVTGGVASVHRFVSDVAPKPRQTQAGFWNGEAHPYTRPEYNNHLIGPIMQRPSSTAAQYHPAQEQLVSAGAEGDVSSGGAQAMKHNRAQSARPAGYGSSTPAGQHGTGPPPQQPHAVSAVNVTVNHHLAWTTPQPSPSAQGVGVSFPDPNVTLPSREMPSYVSSQAASQQQQQQQQQQPSTMARSTAAIYSMGMSRPNAAVGSKTPHIPPSTTTTSPSTQHLQQQQKTSGARFGDQNAGGDGANALRAGNTVVSPRSNTESGRHHPSSFGVGDGAVSNKENLNQGNIPLSEANLTQGTLALVKGRLVTLPPSNAVQKQDATVASKQAEESSHKPSAKAERVHSASDLLVSKTSEKKGILKRPGGSGTMTKAASIGALNQNSVKDSLELAKTQYHMQGNRGQTKKKSVRWTDLHYDDDASSDSGSDITWEGSKSSNGPRQGGRSRPMSAKPANRGGGAGSRARSASAGASRPPLQPATPSHASNRPRAAAHIITHSMEAMELAGKTYTALQAQVAAQEAKSASYHPASQMAQDSQSKVAINSRTAGGIVYTVTNPANPGKMSAPEPKSMTSGSENNGDHHSHPTSSSQQPQAAVRHQQAPIYNENGLRIDRTPTDEEINFLWDKVRTCLNRTAPASSEAKKNALNVTDPSRTSAPMSHKYIDGATLALGSGKSNLSVASTYSQPNSYPNRGAKPASANSNTYLRRYGLLQQRRAQSARQPPSRPHAGQEPQHASTYQPQEDVTESLAGFLVAEQLMGQASLGDNQIQAAIEDAQARQNAYNTAHPGKKVPSALSLEEQRLLESLDRLNENLKVCEARQGGAPGTTTSQPPPQQPAPAPQGVGFRGHGPRIIQRRTLSGGVAAPMRVNNQPQTYR